MSRIIIVGADSDLCKVMAKMFIRNGHDAQCIKTVAEALEGLVNAVPDLLVLNMTSKDVSPLTAVLDLIDGDERLSAIKTVVLSQSRASEGIAKLIAAGAKGYVSWERTPPDEVVRALECWLPEGCQ